MSGYFITLPGTPEQQLTFEDPCEFLKALDIHLAGLPADQRSVDDRTAEGITALREICTARGQASMAPPVQDASTPPVPTASGQDGAGVGGVASPPPREDNARTLGAPDPPIAAAVGSRQSAPGVDDGRSLVEQFFDPNQPMHDYDVADRLAANGVPADEIGDALERVRRNLAPRGRRHPQLSLDRTPVPLAVEDPVILATGQFATSVVDVVVPSPGMPLQFARSYRSAPVSYGPLGFCWDHEYNVSLRPLDSGAVAVWTGHHAETVYTRIAAGGFEPPAGVFSTLVHDPGNGLAPERWRLEDRDRTTFVFERPPGWPRPEDVPLVRIEHAAGHTHRLTHHAEGCLSRVTDDAGRYLAFDYGPGDLIVAVSDHAGRTWRYGYGDAGDHLCSVMTPSVPPDGKGLTTCYEYDREQAHPALVHNLIRIVNPAGCTVVENSYGADPGSDDFGRVVDQRYGSHSACFRATKLQHVEHRSESINVPALRVETWSEAGYRIYTFGFRGDLLDERYRLVKDGSYRLVARNYAYDGQGNQVEAREPNGLLLRQTFDHGNADPRARANLLRAQLVAPPTVPMVARELLRATYEPRFHQIKTLRREYGGTTVFVYDHEVSATSRGHVVRIEHPDVTRPDGSVERAAETFQYDGAGRIARTQSAAGHVFTCEYYSGGPASGYLRRTVAGAGVENEWQEFDYDAWGNLTRTRSAGGVESEAIFDAIGRISRLRKPVVDGKRGDLVLHYGPDGFLRARESLEPAIRDEFVNDVLGRMIETTLGAGTLFPCTWQIARTSNGSSASIVEPGGVERRFRYDERGLLIGNSVHGPGAPPGESRFIYDRFGLLTSAVDPMGTRIDYSYDAWGQLFDIVLPGANNARTRMRHSYAAHLLTGVEVTGTPGAGAAPIVLERTEFHYDERERLVRQVEGPQTIRHEYDRDNRLTSIRHHRGSTLRMKHDALGRVREVADALGNRAVRHYDNCGNLVRVDEHERTPGAPDAVYTARMDYDDRDRLVRLVDPLGNTTRLHYDDRDLLIAAVDPLQQRTEYDYDFAGALSAARLIDRPGAAPIEHRWERDILGRVAAYRTPEGHETRYTWDRNSRWTSMTTADGATWRREFDGAGRVVREERPSGIALRHAYGADGMPARRRVEDAAGASLLPDLVVERDGLGRPTTAMQGGSRIEWAYDTLGRVVRETTDAIGCTWTYDDAGGRANLRYPDGRVDRHEFDELGRLSAVRLLSRGGSGLNESAAAGRPLVAYEYAGAERLHRRTNANGTTEEFLYDNGRRLGGVVHRDAGAQILTQIEYVYDAAGRRRLVRTRPAPGPVALNAFDGAGRLASVRTGVDVADAPLAMSQSAQDARVAAIDPATANLVHTFTLDDDDGRAKRAIDTAGVTSSDTYVLGPTKVIQRIDRIVGGAAQSLVVEHDADGLRRRDDRHAYAYDGLGRLRTIHDALTGQLLFEQDFDPLGRPLRRIVDGQQTGYLHFGASLLQETAASGQPLRQYTWGAGGDDLVAISDGRDRWMHQDARRSLLAVTDADGKVRERYAYDPFGAAYVFAPDGASRAGSTLGVRPIFGGHPTLAGRFPELFDARARLYDAATGAFLQPDRLGASDSSNRYAYAAQNPADLTDPSGEVVPVIAAMVIIGALSGAGYSGYDACDHPERYRGSFSFRTMFQVSAGAAVGAVSAMAGEVALGAMGVGSAASGGAGALMGAARALTLPQTLVAGGTVGVVSGGVWRVGFHGMFPEQVDPPSAGTMAFDYVFGGAVSLGFRAIEAFGHPFSTEGRTIMYLSAKEAYMRAKAWRLQSVGRQEAGNDLLRKIAELRVGRLFANEFVGHSVKLNRINYRGPAGEVSVINPEIDVVTLSRWIQVKTSQNAWATASVNMKQAAYTSYGRPPGKDVTFFIEPGPSGRIPTQKVKALNDIGIFDIRVLTPELRGLEAFPLPFGGTSGLPFAHLPAFLLNPNAKREPGSASAVVGSL